MRRSRIVLSATLVLTMAVTALAEKPKLDLNDVSWLWPVPRTSNDLSRVISMGDLKAADGTDVWSDSQFQDLLRVVASDADKVGNSDVDFEPSFNNKSNWRIAGMRVDPSAPGGHASIRGAFGSAPQIRLIVQPVTNQNGRIQVHDTAVHLVYEYIEGRDPANQRRKIPDDDKFGEIIADLDTLKAVSTDGGAPTAGVPLGVHPGFTANVNGLRTGIKEFLSKHLAADKLSAMALMGIEQGIEPWIFVAMTRLPTGFGPIPLPIPAAKSQMIDFRAGGAVSPDPEVSNRTDPANPNRKFGVATAVMFFMRRSELNNPAQIGTVSGQPVFDGEVLNRDIPDVIAHPSISHFFNTDCVSCHTETRRRLRFNLSPGDFAYRLDGQPPGINPNVLPSDDWNVRNFGWFPPHFFIGGGPTVATVTQRTANETAEVVQIIERCFRCED